MHSVFSATLSSEGGESKSVKSSGRKSKGAGKGGRSRKEKLSEGRGKKYLVTGACGFSGSHMVDLLVEKGCDVIATDVESAPRRWLNPEVNFIPSNLLDKKSLEKVVDSVDTIFHPAAIFSYTAPLEDLIKVNVEGTKNLLDVAVSKGVRRVIVWSTAGVYDVDVLKGEKIDETGPIGPYNNYEYSKLKQEEIAMEYHINGKIEVTIIRPAPIYGPRNFYGFANIIFGVASIPGVIVPIIENKSVSVHVRDVSEAAFFLSNIPEAAGEVYNVVDDSEYSFSELVLGIARALGKPAYQIPIKVSLKPVVPALVMIARISQFLNKKFPIVFENPVLKPLKYLEEDTARYVERSFRFSNEKLKKLGYTFKYPDVLKGVEETIAWYREYGYL